MYLDLNKVYVGDIIINDKIIYEEDYYKKSAIKKLDPVKIDGKIAINDFDELNITLNIDGNMYLEDAVSLELVKYPFNVLVEETIDFNDEYFSVANNKMDLKEFVWKNIVLEMPIRVTGDENNQELQGDGWSLNAESKGNNAFSKLNNLFKN